MFVKSCNIKYQFFYENVTQIVTTIHLSNKLSWPTRDQQSFTKNFSKISICGL